MNRLSIASAFLVLISPLCHAVDFEPGFQSREMAAHQYATSDAVGDLGGVPVTIPKHFASYLEYDNDPGWGKRRTGPTPPRTHASRIRSFGFDVRYPDMQGLSSPLLVEDQKSYTIFNTPWIGVSVISGDFYSGDGFLDRILYQDTEGARKRASSTIYEQQKDKYAGLTIFHIIGVDENTGTPNREYRNARDLFVAYHKGTMRAKAVIYCSNRNIPSAGCKHMFSLDNGQKAEVTVRYRREDLKKWNSIQESVSKLILGFKDGH
ncbi:MAG: hypothetical protein JSS57_09815 [Proteobacteria bacterium]|nr:hypothetical protein [Pseudomonadota bacterium]